MNIALLGLPFDESSSFLRGCAKGPDAIRQALHCPSSNSCAENEVDVLADGVLSDYGNLTAESAEAARTEIESRVTDLLSDESRVVCLGGDHAITYPVLRAVGGRYANLTVVHLDAHPDLYPVLDGNRYSHACPFARALEDGAVSRLVQVGIRTMNATQRQVADQFKVEIITAGEYAAGRRLTDVAPIQGPVYLSLDLDVLDPAFAPGVSHHEPGGLSVRDVISIVQTLPGQLVSADIVELNPTRDLQDVTARVAAKLLKETVARMLAETGPA